MQEVVLTENSKAIGKRIAELMIPATVNILAIKRGDFYITPNGSTKLIAHDILYILAENKRSLELLGDALDIKNNRNSFENFSI